jgi:hypothetical protein
MASLFCMSGYLILINKIKAGYRWRVS